MRTDELLQKLKTHDLAAYNYVYETYGWELHNYLQEKCPDKDLSAEVFRLAMNSFCDDLAGQSEADLLELILRTYADRALQEITKPVDLPEHFQLHLPDSRKSDAGQIELPKKLASVPQRETASMPETFPNDGSMTPPVLGASSNGDFSWDEEDMPDEDLPEKGKVLAIIGKVLLIFLLVVAVAAIAWAVLGIAVKMGWISGLRFNLGHAWFNQNIAPWF